MRYDAWDACFGGVGDATLFSLGLRASVESVERLESDTDRSVSAAGRTFGLRVAALASEATAESADNGQEEKPGEGPTGEGGERGGRAKRMVLDVGGKGVVEGDEVLGEPVTGCFVVFSTLLPSISTVRVATFTERVCFLLAELAALSPLWSLGEPTQWVVSCRPFMSLSILVPTLTRAPFIPPTSTTLASPLRPCPAQFCTLACVGPCLVNWMEEEYLLVLVAG